MAPFRNLDPTTLWGASRSTPKTGGDVTESVWEVMEWQRKGIKFSRVRVFPPLWKKIKGGK